MMLVMLVEKTAADQQYLSSDSVTVWHCLSDVMTDRLVYICTVMTVVCRNSLVCRDFSVTSSSSSQRRTFLRTSWQVVARACSLPTALSLMAGLSSSQWTLHTDNRQGSRSTHEWCEAGTAALQPRHNGPIAGLQPSQNGGYTRQPPVRLKRGVTVTAQTGLLM